jgi:hypothetical protein
MLFKLPVNGRQPLSGATPPHLTFFGPPQKNKLIRRAGFEPLAGFTY